MGENGLINFLRFTLLMFNPCPKLACSATEKLRRCTIDIYCLLISCMCTYVLTASIVSLNIFAYMCTEMLMYIYTSGTTGFPKAAKITNQRQVWACESLYCMCEVLQGNRWMYTGAQKKVATCSMIWNGTASLVLLYKDKSAYVCADHHQSL
jgi:hypothetical protein